MQEWYKLTTIFLFLLLFATSVAAQPPFDETGSEFSIGKFSMTTNMHPVYELGKDIEFYTHIFNQSGHPVEPDDVECQMELFNFNGSSIFVRDFANVDNSKRIIIDTENITKTGYYPYNFFCNDSNGGAFRSSKIELTETTNSATHNVSEMSFFFWFGFVLIIGIFAFGLITKDAATMAIGSILITIMGGYIMLNGIILYSNELTDAISLIMIVFGAYIFLRVLMEEGIDLLNSVRG